MHLSPDEIEVFRLGALPFDLTVVGTWAVMAVVLPTLILCRRTQLVEAGIEFIGEQSAEIFGRDAKRFVPLVGTLFIFILACNWSSLVPGFMPPTASLSTTAALASAVMLSVMVYGIRAQGIRGYFGRFVKPIPILLPFNVIGEAIKGFSLAIRLYGNIMSGTFLAGLAFVLAPAFFPALLNIYGLLAGTIQPYIFMVLAVVYIASAIGDDNQKKGE
ncbi:MAG: F0F1 ATP synthase subunit A [Rickettsiales bacterium]|jgi:F-type H+-transporting ATPase subunit a|nr:F0F1 ATP synthase subunit A [Rickettsiales bacterium]